MTQWERPIVTGNDFIVSAKFPSNRVNPNVLHQKHGRPPNAIGSFGFGGLLCSVRGTSNIVFAQKVCNIAPSSTIVGLETNKYAHGIVGPLTLADQASVASLINTNIRRNQTDYLWSLIRIVSESKGTLRSSRGVNDPQSPESSILNLLLDTEAENALSAVINPLQPTMDEKSHDIELLLVRGKREEAVDQAIIAGKFALAILIATMCSRDTYFRACRTYAQRIESPSSPLHTLALLFSGQLQNENPSIWSGNVEYLRSTWKNHLAAIISNRMTGWVNLVNLLGDKMGDLNEDIAAHCCKMIAGKTPLEPKAANQMTLLGMTSLNSDDLVLGTDAALIAFSRTEAYEWAKRKGNPSASFKCLSSFKLMYAMILAEYGFIDAAKRYVEAIKISIDALPSDVRLAKLHPQSLTLALVMSDREHILATLGAFESRLYRRLYTETSTEFVDMDVPGDADNSFTTAVTTLTERPRDDSLLKSTRKGREKMKTMGMITEGIEPEKNEKSNMQRAASRAKAISGEAPPASTTKDESLRLNFAMNTKENMTSDSGKSFQHSETSSRPPAVPSYSETTHFANEKTTQPKPLATGDSGSLNVKPPLESNRTPSTSPSKVVPSPAPKSAPASLPVTPRSGSLLGIKNRLTRWLNPEATQADLGEGMQAYYDEDRKVWVFPGEDPDEVARPIGPPPTTQQQTSSPAPAPAPANDPLANLMAPPQRGPARSTLPKPTQGKLRNNFDKSGPPKFAVFQPAQDKPK